MTGQELEDLKAAAKELSPVYMNLLLSWKKAQEAAREAIAAEMALRQVIYKASFEDPKEGTNHKPLANGWSLNGVRKVNRTVDKAVLPSVVERLKEKKIPIELVIAYKPSLINDGYKNLQPEIKAIVDEAITAKEGAPSLEIVLPAKNKK